MPAKGTKHTPEALARIRRGTRFGISKRAALARIAPRELLELQRNGTLSGNLRPFAADAIGEAVSIVHELGGDAQITAQRLALVQDTARLGLLVRALVASIAQGESIDVEQVSKVATLISARRSALQALGLDRVEREVESLSDYLAHRTPQVETAGPNGSGPDRDGAAGNDDA